MKSVLLVSSEEKTVKTLTTSIMSIGETQIFVAKNGAQARQTTSINEYDLVIIDAPLTDEYGHELATALTESSCAGVILLKDNEDDDQIIGMVEDFGVLVVTKPIINQLFNQAIKLALASGKRIHSLKNANEKLHNKIDEIKLINRAKCALIQYLKLTEPQAHRFIAKQAMDMRISRKEVAESILKTYEC